LSTSGDAVRGQDGIAGTTNPKLKTHVGQVSKPSKKSMVFMKELAKNF
jgi:hypothetical protein